METTRLLTKKSNSRDRKFNADSNLEVCSNNDKGEAAVRVESSSISWKLVLTTKLLFVFVIIGVAVQVNINSNSNDNNDAAAHLGARNKGNGFEFGNTGITYPEDCPKPGFDYSRIGTDWDGVMQLGVYYIQDTPNATSKQPEACALPGWHEDEDDITNPFMLYYGRDRHNTEIPPDRMTGSAQVAYIKFLLACAQRDTTTTNKKKNTLLTFTVLSGGHSKNVATDVWARNWNNHNFKDFNGDPILVSGQKSYHSPDCFNNDAQICIIEQDAYTTKTKSNVTTYVGKYKGLKINRINGYVDDSPEEWYRIINNEEEHGSLGLDFTYQYVTCADTIRKIDISQGMKYTRAQMVRNFNLAAIAFPKKCGANVLCPFSKHAVNIT